MKAQLPLSAATVVVFAYRGVTFWFPLVLGLIAFRGLAGGTPVDKMEIN
jgi:uncharacterized membrane protein YbhN (UPF0104 family)